MTDLVPTNISQNTTVRALTWTPLAQNQNGGWFPFSDYADKTVHMFGTFNGATVTIQGSNDPLVLTSPDTADAQTLVDPQGTLIAKTSPNMSQVLENPLYVRPSVSGGDGGTAISVIIAVKRNN